MTDSILTSIKEALGVEGTNHFDSTLVEAINSAFFTLNQIGVGPETGYAITGSTELWTDYIPDSTKLQGVRTYVYLKTKLVFDPPTQSFLLQNYKDQIAELEWRLRVEVGNNPPPNA